jgi:hypothetical protein
VAPTSPDTPAAGDWRCTAAGRAHYFLAGRPLGGADLAPGADALGPSTRRRHVNFLQPYCAGCKRLNVARHVASFDAGYGGGAK